MRKKLKQLNVCFEGLQDPKTEKPTKAERARFEEKHLELSGLELQSRSSPSTSTGILAATLR